MSESAATPAAKPAARKSQKKYATIRHPTIEAAVEGLYQFASKGKAIERLNQIRRDFVVKKQDAESTSNEHCQIWIRGYAMKDGEEKLGYRGHYAALNIVQNKEKLWTIKAERIELALHLHPQRERPKMTHPDWNHPILRSVKAGRLCDSYEQAMGELETLHVEFPDVTIPAKDRLHLIIYEGKKGESHTRKYQLVLVPKEEGRFLIVAEAKSPPPPRKRTLKQVSAADAPETVGRFTAKVKGDRLRKRK